MNQEMLNSLGQMGLSRAMQQKLRKVPSAQLENMLQKYGGFQLNEGKKLSNREQLRNMIKERENMRLGRETKFTENNNTSVVDVPVLSEAEKQKRHKNRMKRLNQQYGVITDADYYDALEKTKEVKTDKLSTSEQDEFQKYYNKIDLYNHQHENKEEEKELDLSEF